ncbi:16S rRNA (cytosine1402-N4)-methyltransferase [Bowdeniella nasicola]|uniref:Ribosomal RNA small subunit methyltransferase H n=1 Tax=Bowdeniella nasicola TaxID=208480 RepID=A0A1H4BA69_9ACTO|nr:16S rRNA (cytosine(1402)-N(4))-methyltransferase RsmH [Bowdeniella nasicola]SEA45105.1 16S rRNA (cytosine1402-N4)-methyltransferase [Bowdeniella nasicola]
MAGTTRHIPVMRDRCVELLSATPKGVIIDATLGLGGHSEAILEANPELVVAGIDRDDRAIALASERLARFGDRFHTFHTTYDEIGDVAEQMRERAGLAVVGILMDLGVSSMQLDEAERGFSYARSAPLDMRMDPTSEVTAASILATASVGELTRTFRTYGEEKYANRIAARIVEAREQVPLTTTDELVAIIRECIPQSAKRTGGHPAKRVFQALRVAVNDELRILAEALPRAIDALDVGGVLVVESYQSLEDRIVKQVFAAGATSTAPLDLPIIPESAKPRLKLLTRGAERADERELEANPRSAPVRLRAVRKIRSTT